MKMYDFLDMYEELGYDSDEAMEAWVDHQELIKQIPISE